MATTAGADKTAVQGAWLVYAGSTADPSTDHDSFEGPAAGFTAR